MPFSELADCHKRGLEKGANRFESYSVYFHQHYLKSQFLRPSDFECQVKRMKVDLHYKTIKLRESITKC